MEIGWDKRGEVEREMKKDEGWKETDTDCKELTKRGKEGKEEGCREKNETEKNRTSEGKIRKKGSDGEERMVIKGIWKKKKERNRLDHRKGRGGKKMEDEEREDGKIGKDEGEEEIKTITSEKR